MKKTPFILCFLWRGEDGKPAYNTNGLDTTPESAKVLSLSERKQSTFHIILSHIHFSLRIRLGTDCLCYCPERFCVVCVMGKLCSARKNSLEAGSNIRHQLKCRPKSTSDWHLIPIIAYTLFSSFPLIMWFIQFWQVQATSFDKFYLLL